jgi:flavin reductase (DIM6/NTAB) family NADH-FMN oxidoreductase RutF
MQQTLDGNQIDALEKRYRTNFINSLSGYKSANLLGSINSSGQTNLALMTSVFHIGANPPLMGLLIRPHSVPRHSLENLLEQQCYTLNAVSCDMFEQAHQTSAHYHRDVSEFDAAGLTEEYSDALKAPYVLQSPVKIGLSLVETQTLDVNNTVLVIGQIIEVQVDFSLMADDGKLDLNAAGLVAVSGLDEYHTASSVGRLPYASLNDVR